MSEPVAPPPSGPQLGQYLLLDKLGQGGMGAVYKALHSRLKRVVAIKVLPPERLGDPHAVARFFREMEAVGKLDHPNIIRATDAGEAAGQHFLIMEYLLGLNLHQLVRRPVADACEKVFGLPPRLPPFESGQLVLHKRQCWRELQLALWYNAHADFVYEILWGDKDTYNVAWRQLGRDFAMPRPECDWDEHTILQFGPDGDILFQHRCRDKFRLEEVFFPGTSQNFTANLFNPRLRYEELCFQWLEELRRSWEMG